MTTILQLAASALTPHAQHPQIAPELESARLLGIKLLNVEDFLLLLFRFGINFAVTALVVRWLYFRRAKRPEYVFAYLLINATIFLLCFLLEGVKLELGFALGLFAIFGIIRYRTDPIPIKEMTYLFAIIAIAVMNALSNKKVSYAELAFANLAIVGTVWILEAVWTERRGQSQRVIYDRVDLLRPDRRKELIADLSSRLGLDVQSVKVGEISLLRDTAELTLQYFSEDHPHFTQPPSAPRHQLFSAEETAVDGGPATAETERDLGITER